MSPHALGRDDARATLAQAAYTAFYAAQTGLRALPWESLHEADRTPWYAAAQAVVDEVRPPTMADPMATVRFEWRRLKPHVWDCWLRFGDGEEAPGPLVDRDEDGWGMWVPCHGGMHTNLLGHAADLATAKARAEQHVREAGIW